MSVGIGSMCADASIRLSDIFVNRDERQMHRFSVEILPQICPGSQNSSSETDRKTSSYRILLNLILRVIYISL